MFYPPGSVLTNRSHQCLQNVCASCSFVYYFRGDFQNVNMYFDFLNTDSDFLNNLCGLNKNSAPVKNLLEPLPLMGWC
jgi:hypothetical protein